MKKVFVAGGVSWDTIVKVDHFPGPFPGTVFSSAHRETVGSTGAGKALNLARLGFDVTLHTPIGGDATGEKIMKFLRNQPLRMLYDHDPKGSETHVNLMDSQGGRISIYTGYPTFEPAIRLSAVKSRIAKADFVVLNIINYVRLMIPVAKKYGKKIWCDLHDYDGGNPYHEEFIAAADYVFFSSDKMEGWREFMERLIRQGKELVVCTHGKKGATLLSRDGGEWHEDILGSFDAVDSNGAGDSFFAGFLYGFAGGRDYASCMKLGSIVAGFCVSSENLYGEDMDVEAVNRRYVREYGVGPLPKRDMA